MAHITLRQKRITHLIILTLQICSCLGAAVPKNGAAGDKDVAILAPLLPAPVVSVTTTTETTASVQTLTPFLPAGVSIPSNSTTITSTSSSTLSSSTTSSTPATTQPIQNTTPTSTPSSSPQSSSSAMSPGALAGVIGGGLALVVLMGLLILWHHVKNPKETEEAQQRRYQYPEASNGNPNMLKRASMAAKRASMMITRARPKHIKIDTKMYEQRAQMEAQASMESVKTVESMESLQKS